MTRPIKILAGIALSGVLLAVALVGNALAQPPVPRPESGAASTGWTCPGASDPQHFEAMENALAGALKLTPDQLRSQLASGQSLLEIARAQGIDEQELGDGMYKAMADMMSQYVAQGQLTQEQADAMIEAMKSHMDPAHLAAMFSMMGSGRGMMGGSGMMAGGCGGGPTQGGANRPAGMMGGWRGF